MIDIPAGDFTQGLSPERAQALVVYPEPPDMYGEQTGETVEHVEAFRISNTEVTNAEYAAFVADHGYDRKDLWTELDADPELEAGFRAERFVDQTGKPGPLTWEGGTFVPGTADAPVRGVSYYEALAYTRWKGVRLPTELEWEYAARGADKRLYPWGDKAPEASWFAAQHDGATLVGTVPEDVSAFGLFDMGCNAAEWVAGVWVVRPGRRSPDIRDAGTIRGANYGAKPDEAIATLRRAEQRTNRYPTLGFRVAADAR